MNQNVLIQQKNGKKVCNIDEHYELLIIEFNFVFIKKMIIKQEDDDLIQKEHDSIIKTSHTDQIVVSRSEDEMPVQANFEKNAVSVNFEDKIPILNSMSVNSMKSNSD
jgi:hypothetical protein